MIAIVQCRHHHSALEIPSLPDLKEKLICKLFGVFVISCPAMDMKENQCPLLVVGLTRQPHRDIRESQQC